MNIDPDIAGAVASVLVFLIFIAPIFRNDEPRV